MSASRARIMLAAVLVPILVIGAIVVSTSDRMHRTKITAYFANSNGIYSGDNVVILGVPVGKVDKIEPEPTRVKVSFWIDADYQTPADAKAVVLSPNLVTARAIELTPAYTDGPQLQDGAVIPQERTAVPVEFASALNSFTSFRVSAPGLPSPIRMGAR